MEKYVSHFLEGWDHNRVVEKTFEKKFHKDIIKRSNQMKPAIAEKKFNNSL